jgi:hypothetical protein
MGHRHRRRRRDALPHLLRLIPARPQNPGETDPRSDNAREPSELAADPAGSPRADRRRANPAHPHHIGYCPAWQARMVRYLQEVSRLPISDHVIRAFLSSDPSNRNPILEAVQSAGFTIENIQEDYNHPEKWGFFLKPNRSLSNLFRLDREVLLWATTYPQFQARDIENIKSVIDERGVRLTRSFAILEGYAKLGHVIH